jgi:hypothetical protein
LASISDSTFAKAVLYSASVLRIFGFITSDGCGIDFVILRVGSDKADEDDAPVVVDFNNETEGVTFNVEENAISEKYIGALVVFFDVLRPAPICGFGFMEPSFKRAFGGGVLRAVVPTRNPRPPTG